MKKQENKNGKIRTANEKVTRGTKAELYNYFCNILKENTGKTLSSNFLCTKKGIKEQLEKIETTGDLCGRVFVLVKNIKNPETNLELQSHIVVLDQKHSEKELDDMVDALFEK